MTRLARFSNNASSKLAANLTSVGLTCTVTPGDGVKFPTLTTGQFFMATLVKASGTKEIVKVTARATDTFTIERAAEPVGDVQVASSFTAGDRIELRMTAGVLGDELDRLDAAAFTKVANISADYSVLSTDISTLFRVDTSGGVRSVSLPLISSLSSDFEILAAKTTADANVVNVLAAGSDTINGLATYSLTSQWSGAWLIADRVTNTWTAINSGSGGVGNAVVEAFVGAGAAGPFTLTGNPGSKNNTDVYVGGVYQQKSTYTLVGLDITLGGVVGVGVSVEVIWGAPVAFGVPNDGSVTTAKLADGAVTEPKLGALAVSTAKLADDAVTLAKMQNIATARALGRVAAGSGDIQELTGDDLATLVGVVPAGWVADFARNTAPTGWLKANGAAVSRTTYAALFAAISTTFGIGDGSTTFNLPDLRGEFRRGWDDGRGVDSGRVFGSTQADELKSHLHTGVIDPVTAFSFDGGGSTYWVGNSGSSDATGGAETRPRNVALLVCIKF